MSEQTNPPETTPGVGPVNVEVYRDLLVDITDQSSRMLVGKLMEKAVGTFDEKSLPAEARAKFLETANLLKTTKVDGWKKVKDEAGLTKEVVREL